ncbi:hypothetical protein BI313_10760 [Xanthomonas vesicatoria]|nr:hypothetical protein BI313_10760 [Xanthomonas vesicatoria]
MDHNHEHPVFAVIEPVKAFDNASLKDWIARRLEPGCEVYSDGLACFRRLEDAGHAHTTLDTGGGRAATQAQAARWLNVVLANVKRVPSAAPTMRCAKPNTRGATWPKRPIDSTADFAWSRCCRDWRRR